MTSTRRAGVRGEEEGPAFCAQLACPVQGLVLGGTRTASCKGPRLGVGAVGGSFSNVL